MENSIDTKLFFLKKNEEIDLDNYVLFCDFINMRIRTTVCVDYELTYFDFNNKGNSSYYCNVDICGVTEDNPVTIATFYKQTDNTHGITEILKKESYLGKLKMKLFFENPLESLYYNGTTSTHDSECTWDMKIYIYMKKDFLLNLYDEGCMPQFLFNIIKKNCRQQSYRFNYKDIVLSDGLYSEQNLKKSYKREQFNYQKDNIYWMLQQEQNIRDNIEFNTYHMFTDYKIYDIPNVDITLISNLKGKILNCDELNKINIKIKGGVLSDEVGLGKTFSMLSLIVETLNMSNDDTTDNNNTTLLICPIRLCTQWIQEIEKTYDLKYKLIRDIRQFKKLTKNDYKENNIILISYNLLSGKKYLELLENEPELVTLFHNYKWARTILDEGHEFVTHCNRKTVNLVKNYLNSIKSKYRWICSGTPFNSIDDYGQILNYITVSEQEYYITNIMHNVKELSNILFRRNTKDSVKIQVSIPKPRIETEFLDMSTLERLIYDSALNNVDKKIELCNHIMVSDEHLTILGNKPLTLEEIHNKMTNFYRTKIEKYTKRVEKYNNELDKLNSKKNEEQESKTVVKKEKKEKNENEENDIDDSIQVLNVKKEETLEKLKELTAKYNIFNGLDDKIKEDTCCPICMEELDSLTKTLTPCGHLFCSGCISDLKNHSNGSLIKCALCRHSYDVKTTVVIKSNYEKSNEPKLGTKIEHLIKTVQNIINKNKSEGKGNKKIIVFSQWDNMLKLISKVFDDYNINHIFLNGSLNIITSKLRKFKLENDLSVVLMSSDKSPSGLNLTEATTVILLDTLNTTKEKAQIIEEQAIGRAVRIGQKDEVLVKRFIMRNSIEHDYYIRNITD